MLLPAFSSCDRYRFFCPLPAPDRDPDRRRPELPRAAFFAPVPDAPARFALFRAPVEPRPDVWPVRLPGASGFEPLPGSEACDRRDPRDLPARDSTSPELSAVVRARRRDAVPRARPPRPPWPPPVVSSAVSRSFLVAREASCRRSRAYDLWSRFAMFRASCRSAGQETFRTSRFVVLCSMFLVSVGGLWFCSSAF